MAYWNGAGSSVWQLVRALEGPRYERGRMGVQLIVLVVNPGGNSLKVQLVRCNRAQAHASEGFTLASVGIEAIATAEAKFLVYQDKKVVHSDPVQASDYAGALENILA